MGVRVDEAAPAAPAAKATSGRRLIPATGLTHVREKCPISANSVLAGLQRGIES
jgi:hypothetical protein